MTATLPSSFPMTFRLSSCRSVSVPWTLSGSLIRICGSLIRLSRQPMRADAKKNHSHLLAVARDVVAKHGADASMRDIARRADVGLATLLRHFPTREALFEALLRTKLDALTQKAGELEASKPPDEALLSWFREGVAFVQSYSGVCRHDGERPRGPGLRALRFKHSDALSGRATLAPCSGRRNGARRYGWGGPVRADVGARLGGRPTLVRAAGRSSLSHHRERHPDKALAAMSRRRSVWR